MRSPAELALWDITTPDGADRRFRAEQFPKLPGKFLPHVAGEYRRRFTAGGIPAANEFLLDTTAALEGAAWRLSSSDEDLRLWSANRAQEFARMAARIGDKDIAFLVLSEAARRRGIQPPAGEKGRTVEGAVARLCCPLWWRRQVRKAHGRRVEGSAIGLGLVHTRAGLYASDETVGRRREQRSRNRAMLEAMLAVNEQGQEYTLAALADLSVSNPIIRRGELMTRMAGFEQCAERLGHVGEFYTVTCPSRMHARHSQSGEVNSNYDGTTPGAAQQYLCALWGRARAALARSCVRPYGFRVAEPHHDGTPHWHLLLFVPGGQVAELRATLRRYALRDSPDEVGAQRHRFQAVEIDRSKGTAAGYLAKYVAKNIDAYGLDRVDEDLTGRRDPKECAARVDAWASCWGIRQFQQIGGPPVTVWRELRRLDEQPEGVLENVRFAADQGEWGRYVERMGGPLAPRAQAPVKVAVAWSDKSGRYGEPLGNRIYGVECGGDVVRSRIHEWRVERGRRSNEGCTGDSSTVGAENLFSRVHQKEAKAAAGSIGGGRSNAGVGARAGDRVGCGTALRLREGQGYGRRSIHARDIEAGGLIAIITVEGRRVTGLPVGRIVEGVEAFKLPPGAPGKPLAVWRVSSPRGASAPPWSSVNNCTGRNFGGGGDG